MKYLKQLLIIMAFTFAGEVLHFLIPLPIPASIYGLLLLFLALHTGLLRLKSVQTVGDWMISILPLLFVAPGVSILGCWDLIAPYIVLLVEVILSATVLIFVVSGKVSQWLAERKKDDG